MQSAILASPERRRLLANTRQMARGVNDCRRLTALSVVRTRLEGVAINRGGTQKADCIRPTPAGFSIWLTSPPSPRDRPPLK
jgi:hypothetical protein